jgi:hypothetical protein
MSRVGRAESDGQSGVSRVEKRIATFTRPLADKRQMVEAEFIQLSIDDLGA